MIRRIFLMLLLLLGVGDTAFPAEYFYDDLGRLEMTQYPDGSVLRYSYDNVGNRTRQEIVNNLVTLSPSLYSPQFVGAEVTFTATGKGAGPFEYRFWLFSNGQWELMQDYGTGSQWGWATAGMSAGAYQIQADLRTIGSNEDREAFQSIPYVLLVQPVNLVVLSSTPGSPCLDNTDVRFTASASGGDGNFEFQFWHRSIGGDWTVARPFSTDNVWIWNPSGARGTYAIQASARPVGTTGNGDFSLPLPYVVRSTRIQSLTVTSLPSSPQPFGTQVRFTPVATEGIAPYQFRYRIKDPSQGGIVVGTIPYSNDNTWSWDTSGWPSKTFNIEVSARSAGSSMDNEATSVVAYQLLNPPVESVTVGATPAGPSIPGTTVTISGSASGGVPPYQYQFIVKNSSGGTIYTSAYGPLTTCTWNSNNMPVGNYTFQVNARSAQSQVPVEKSATMTYTLAIPPVTNVTVGATPAGPSVPGTNVTISGSASGGVPPYQYQFIVKNSSGVAVLTTAYGPATTSTWNTNNKPVGTYTFQVNARSAQSQVPVEKSATMTYVLQ